jgi:hypothetical protein
MDRNTPTERAPRTSLFESFERYLQDKGKGLGGDGGNYRRNAAHELERFAEWAAGVCYIDHNRLGIFWETIDVESLGGLEWSVSDGVKHLVRILNL